MNSDSIIIEEQGLRDGLQNLPRILPLDMKLDFIRRLVNAGVRRIQVTSFVHPKWVPAMADAEELCSALSPQTGVEFSALVLNNKGVERAVSAGIQYVAASISASDAHSRKNANKSLEDAKKEFREMTALARQHHLVVRGGLQCVFGCRYEGAINEELIYDMTKHHLDCGVQEMAFADSTGMGNPLQMKRMLPRLLELCGNVPITLHLHNTENKGYANVVAALETGIKQFDTAYGGLGGCPFIQGATGNIATEDTVHMLHQMGYTTGIDLQQVAAISRDMQDWLGTPLPGLMYSLLLQNNFRLN
ncbi:MAG: hydroxymethylglutaryl-CoA lyase [Chitinophagaceae bacterium]|nr:hydroxymethylglutaryl-CoA lyase [Chitinophagaceae bacterium]MCA6513454.1 hydroxymethylglutaryl-CoA lyase [Chitinophagaceae bacterium]